MAKVNASLKFDAVKGSTTVSLELAGESEMEHELLVQFFSARTVALVPFHVGDGLESRFVIQDAAAFAKAQRACENRIRAREGRPSVEQEQEALAAKKAAIEAQAKADADAKAAGFKDATDQAQAKANANAQASLAKAIVDEQEKRSKNAVPPPVK